MSQDGAPQPRVVRGTVTPSRASRFFLPRTRAAPPTPETPALSISYSTPYAPTPSSAGTPRSAADVPRAWARPLGGDSDGDSDDDENAPPPSPTLACKRRRLAPAPAAPFELPTSAPAAVRRPSRGAAPCAVLHRLRTHAPRFRMPHPTSHTPFFSRMTTREAYPYTLESEVPLAMASPLCVAYMHRARDADDPLPCLAVGDDEGRVHLLDTRVPADALDQPYVRHTTKPLVHGSLFALEWRADDAVLALGGSDYSVAAWDVQHEVCVASYDAHEGSARALAWDPCGGGRLLASGARDGAIYLWDVRQAAPAVHIPRAHRLPRTKRGARSAGVTSLVFRSDGQLVSAASEHGVLHSWDWRAPVRPSAQSADVSLRGAQNTRPHGVSSLAYAPRRARLYAACTDGSVYPLDAGLGDALLPDEPRVLWDAAQRHNTLYARLALYDERFLALGCNTGDVVVWDAAARGTARAAVLPRAHAANAEVNGVAWSLGDDGPTLVSASDDQTVRVWRAAT